MNCLRFSIGAASALLLVGTVYDLPAQTETEIPDASSDLEEAPSEVSNSESSALGVRQQRVKRMLLDLERKFAELSETLREEQPEQAERLTEAFRQSKALLMEQRMDAITELLNSSRLETADDEQDQVIADVKSLIELLLEEEDFLEKAMEEIRQLEAWKEALEGLIAEEVELQEESEALADPDAKLAELAEKMADIQDLIKRQEGIVAETSEAKGLDALDQIADEQMTVRQDTEKAAGEMEAGKPGAKAMSEAEEAQAKAQENLANGNSEEGQKSAQAALDKLNEALKELEEEQKDLQEKTPEDAAELADEQGQTAGKTGQLGEQMAQAGDPQEGQPNAAAQKKVEEAQEQMGEAAQKLAQSQPGEAAPKQDKAVEALEEAKDEVDKRLNELRDEAQQEQLARLEEMFRAMLEKHLGAIAGTLMIDGKREGPERRLARADRIELRKLAEIERALEADASTAETLLLEDGTSIVFLDLVGFLQKQLRDIAELMEGGRTDSFVQEAQDEAKTTLEEMIAALQDAQDKGPAPPGEGQPGEPGEQRQQALLHPSAEIKLLKLTQERINRRTDALDKALQEEGADENLERQLGGVAEMQSKLTNLTRQLSAKLTEATTPAEFD